MYPMAGSLSPQARVSNRVGAITESMRLAIDAKAKALKAAGRPVIVFGAGEPDFPTPDYIPESIRLAGGRDVPVVVGEASGYKVTVDQLEAARVKHGLW